MKRIVLFTDGTWNKPQTDTNIYKLSNACVRSHDQFVAYQDGVGSDGLEIWELLGGAMGIGLWQKIKDGYSQIAHVYEPGDEIFIFGFSRGAFTARSIAGMIAKVGLPTANFDAFMVESAFQVYRNSSSKFDLSRYAMFDAKIKMLGVFDTVGSLGLPAIFGGVDPVLYGFLDTQLHPDVENAFQACSADEQRREFPLTPLGRSQPDLQPCQSVWFSGCHSDVGGGSGSALSDIPLAWMASNAAALGVVFNPSIAFPADPKLSLAPFQDSWEIKWLWPKARVAPTGAFVSNSVKIRATYDTSYRPKALGDVFGFDYNITPTVTGP